MMESFIQFKNNYKFLIFITIFFIFGCQSTYIEQKKEDKINEYSEIYCTVKKQHFGKFNEVIIFDKEFKTMNVNNNIMNCIKDEAQSCKAKLKTKNGYKFYLFRGYMYKYNKGFGHLEVADINNNMLEEASYTEMECNYQ